MRHKMQESKRSNGGPVVVLAIGDVIGRPGRQCLEHLLGEIREEWSPDVVVCNGENLAGGFGITEKIFRKLTQNLEIDVVSTGNHWADKREIYDFGEEHKNLLLPANMFNVESIERGYWVGNPQGNSPIAVINLTCRLFMKGDNDCPFLCADALLKRIPRSTKTIIVDLHGEATSEKQALAHYLDGRVSLVFGTHTHCPTADERILPGGTGFQTDVGMTGAYDSVVGMRKEFSIESFITGTRKKMEPAKSDLWLCGLIAKIDPSSGRCLSVVRIRKTLP